MERATEPTLGSTTTSVSGESSRRSCSATRPSFSWSRTAMRALGADGRATGRSGPGRPVDRPGMAGRSGDYTRGPESPDVDAQVGDAQAAGRGSRRRSGARGPAGAAPGPRSARRPRHRWRSPAAGRPGTPRPPPGTRSATSASKVAMARASRSSSSRPERPGRVGQEVADPGHRPAPRRASRGHRRGTSRAPSGQRPDLPGAGDGAQRRVEVVERRRRHERLGQLGDPPDEVRAPVRVELAEHVVEEQERAAGRRARSAGRARPA